jgi:hypothetical protein
MRSRKFIPSVRRAVILTEACVSIMLVGLVLGMVSLLLTRYARSTDYFLNYRRAQLAAQSCVERLRAGAVEVTDATFTDDAGVTYQIQVSDAEGVWEPLKRVTVTAEVTGKHSRLARYQIVAGVAPTTVREGGGK